jgi:hypothetical protein
MANPVTAEVIPSSYGIHQLRRKCMQIKQNPSRFLYQMIARK